MSYIIMSHCLKQQNNGFNQISNEQELAKKGSNMHILVTNKKTKNIEVLTVWKVRQEEKEICRNKMLGVTFEVCGNNFSDSWVFVPIDNKDEANELIRLFFQAQSLDLTNNEKYHSVYSSNFTYGT